MCECVSVKKGGVGGLILGVGLGLRAWVGSGLRGSDLERERESGLRVEGLGFRVEG